MSIRIPTRKILVVFAAGLAALTGVACGDDSGSTDATKAGDSDDKPAASANPARIVSLSPTATEMLFAIGAGKQVVAVDDQSDHPASAPRTDLSGYTPNLEAIAGYEPDLVVISDDNDELRTGLEKVGATVLVHPAAKTLDDTYDQITELGKATGQDEEAEELVGEMKADIADLVGDVPRAAKGMTYYHELDPTFYSVTSSTFIGSVYALMGLENIADAAPDPAGGYPQLSAEFIVDADPQLVFLADTVCCQQSADSVATRPGWSALAAVEDGAVIELDDSIASRWGPRVVDFVRLVVKALSEVAGTG